MKNVLIIIVGLSLFLLLFVFVAVASNFIREDLKIVWLGNLLVFLSPLAFLFTANLLLSKTIHQDYKTTDFGFCNFPIKQIFFGVLIILLMNVLIVYSVYFFDKNATINLNFNYIQKSISPLLRLLLTMFVVGFWEEIVFRFFVFNFMKIKYNVMIAAIFSSLIFSLVHISSYNDVSNGDNFKFSLLLFSAFLIGVIFSFIYVKYKSIWMLILFHMFWNVFQNTLYKINSINHLSKNANLQDIHPKDLTYYITLNSNNRFFTDDFFIVIFLIAILISLILSTVRLSVTRN